MSDWYVIVTGVNSVFTDLLKSSLHDEGTSVATLSSGQQVALQPMGKEMDARQYRSSTATSWNGKRQEMHLYRRDVIHSLELTVHGTATSVVVILKFHMQEIGTDSFGWWLG